MDKLAYSKYEWLCILQNVNTGGQYDISKMIHEAIYTTEWMTGQAGKMELALVVTPQQKELFFLIKARVGMDEKHGHIINFSINGEGVFHGYITNVGIDDSYIVRVIARDQIFYLKSPDILYTENMTASEIFTDICNRKRNIIHAVNVPSNAVLEPYNYGINYTLWGVIEHAIQLTNIIEVDFGRHYLIRDEFGSLVFTEMGELHSGIRFGDKEYVTNFLYESNIVDDTFNYVKAFRANKEIGMFDTWVAKDTDTINRWGQLGHTFEVEKGLTDAEIMAMTEQRLQFFNVPNETISITAVGKVGIYAGNGIGLNIGKIELAGNFWATHAKHTFRNNYHLMELETFYFGGAIE